MPSHTPDWSELGLHVIAKPTGPKCNIRCRYCFYLGKESLYPDETDWKMDDATLEQYVRQYIEAQSPLVPEVDFAFQGGEPTLMGIDFFRRVVELQKQYARPGVTVSNSLQTNGLLLDDEWCEFLKENNFLVGLSIDGPADLHDQYRVDRAGQGTHDRVVRAVRLLQKHNVDFNALICINRNNAAEPGRVYRFFRDELGVTFLQFIPIVVPVRSRTGGDLLDAARQSAEGGTSALDQEDIAVSDDSVTPAQFGRFLCDVFDIWVREDVGRVFVRDFDQALSVRVGAGATLCVYSKECGRATAIEHNGDLYACDHFVDEPHLLGNIHDTPIAVLANSDQQRQFGKAKCELLPQVCRECGYLAYCNGACPKDRIVPTDEPDRPLNYLCDGFRHFFEHTEPYMVFMAEELRNQRSPANIMQRLRAAEYQAGEQQGRAAQRGSSGGASKGTPGRNDPCPCGSGKKFKKCCYR